MRNRLEINREALPYRVKVPVGDGVFEFEFRYNFADDRFTASLYRGGELVCAGEPLVYGRALFANSYEAGRFPVLRLVPFCENGQEDEVTGENFGLRVFLTVEDEE